ncbi:hypothetical protein [Spirillospora sp. NBC_01491]|uniref:hypothetical protein n=1 Tax=Spirillospora sp. NBC_01491 TaxID=2976007 RepID=UPI002E30BB30|nr:hypothetical protein [Spirillospora sp. NBC_01491]
MKKRLDSWEIVTPAVTLAYAVASRWVETHYPAAGRALLSLGLARRSPVYIKTSELPR